MTKEYLKKVILDIFKSKYPEGSCGKREDECKDENCPSHRRATTKKKKLKEEEVEEGKKSKGKKA